MAIPGTSIQLDHDYDLQLSAQPDGKRTLTLVGGRDELEQSLRIRLLTRLGEDPFAPDVGLPLRRMIQSGAPEYIEGNIQRCLLADPRVLSASALVTSRDGLTRTNTVEAKVTTSDGTVFLFNAPIPVR